MPETRIHRHAADERTLAVFHHLRRPWRGWERADDGCVRVQTADDGVVVRLRVAHAEPERGFAVRSIAGEFERGAVRPVRAVAGYEGGANDVVVFDGESWLTRLVSPGIATPVAPVTPGEDDDAAWAALPPLVTHGQPHERPERVDACCSTTDAVLVVSPRGLSWLARLGERPDVLDVVTDPGAVRGFVEARRGEHR